jgi:hypothetical protein
MELALVTLLVNSGAPARAESAQEKSAVMTLIMTVMGSLMKGYETTVAYVMKRPLSRSVTRWIMTVTDRLMKG